MRNKQKMTSLLAKLRMNRSKPKTTQYCLVANLPRPRMQALYVNSLDPRTFKTCRSRIKSIQLTAMINISTNIQYWTNSWIWMMSWAWLASLTNQPLSCRGQRAVRCIRTRGRTCWRRWDLLSRLQTISKLPTSFISTCSGSLVAVTHWWLMRARR